MLDSALAQRRAGKLQEAESLLRQALTLQPQDAQALYLLAGLLHATGRSADAVAAYRQALKIQPDFPEASMELADALTALGQGDEAAAALHRAAQQHPDNPQILNRLGTALLLVQDLEKAAAVLRTSASLQADPRTWNCLGDALRRMGQHADSMACYDRALAMQPDFAAAFSSRLYALHFAPHYDLEAMFQEHRKWNERYAKPLAGQIRPHTNDATPDRRLRVGYVSPDLRAHSVTLFLENLLSGHDPARVETFCYADVLQPDGITARLQQSAGHWRSLLGQSDADAAQLIRQDQIDILVDLAGHTPNNRLLVFARKPAPVQVSYLGYPDTTGLDAMDYRLTDALADPPDQTDAFFSERLVRLPQTFLCFRPAGPAPAVGPLPARAAGRVTFGSFNHAAKISDPRVELWSQVLLAVPGSRLLLKSAGLGDAVPRRQLHDRFAGHGVGPDRLDMHARIPSLTKHLQLYHQVDIALDTFPYHGTTTTCEALWMGVPVVSLAGKHHASRVGVSLLSNVGLPELIAEDPQGYVRIAVGLAQDLPRLTALRRELRDRMAQSPLLDAGRFARNVEAAYRQMWRTWCQKRN